MGLPVDVNELREKAKKNITIADHMFYVTYNLFNDPKILIAILEHLFLSLSSAMSCLLYYDRYYNRIPQFTGNFEEKFTFFRKKSAKTHKIDKEFIRLIKNIKEVIIAHKQSPVEFIRKNKFVICTNNYYMRTLSSDQVKENLIKTKSFINKIDSIITNEQ